MIETDRCATANFLVFFPVDGEINRKRCGKFCLKSVIGDRPDLCALAMFPHNSQLTLTLEHPERHVRLYFPPHQKPGSGSKGPWTRAQFYDLAREREGERVIVRGEDGGRWWRR